VFRFLVRRILFGILVLWLISVAVFVLFFVAPHDPARTIAGRQATAQTVALVRHRLGLDQPVLEQYWHFLSRLARGDLGYSYYNSEPVRSLIFARLPVTLSLTLGGAILWLILGVGIGVTAARRPRSVFDRAATVFVLGSPRWSPSSASTWARCSAARSSPRTCSGCPDSARRQCSR
jgi:peptide/nickel transport system permease protein